jgi:hypothetical protein
VHASFFSVKNTVTAIVGCKINGTTVLYILKMSLLHTCTHTHSCTHACMHTHTHIELMEKWTNKQICVTLLPTVTRPNYMYFLCHHMIPHTWHSAGHLAAPWGQPSSLGEANRSLGSFNFAIGFSVLLSVLISTWFVLSVFCRKLLK